MSSSTGTIHCGIGKVPQTVTHFVDSLPRFAAARAFGALGLLMVLTASQMHAQGLAGLSGTITDPSGAVVPNARVSITNTATKATRTVMSADVGLYSATQLAPGTYTVHVEASGFRPTLASNVVLPVDQTVTLNVSLELAGVAEVVEVSGAAEAVNTTNASLGAPFAERQIIDLPLNARNIVALLSIQAGVNSSAPYGGRENGGQVNGARSDQQNITLDGVDVNQQEAGSPFYSALPTTLDSVQEFIVATAGQGAEATRSSGAQIQLITKSGSNDFHGSAYEYYRTRATSARNYFAAESQALIRHIPGASLGAPILKNKLFFFGAYEFESDASSQLEERLVPTPQFLDGIIRYQRTDGTYGSITGGPGGLLQKISLIPGDTFNSALIGTNGYFEQYRPFSTDTARTSPSPNDPANVLLYRFNAPYRSQGNVYISRIDYNLNTRNRLYWRGTLHDASSPFTVERFPGYGNSSLMVDNSRGFSAGWNDTLTPALNNNLTFGLTRSSVHNNGNTAPYFSTIFDPLIQTVGAERQAISTWNIVESLSWAHGKHTIQAGTNLRFLDNWIQSFNIVQPTIYRSDASLLANRFASASSPPIASALGPDEFARVADPGALAEALSHATGSIADIYDSAQYDPSGKRLPPSTPFLREFAARDYSFFIQDTWKVRRNLTLILGLNYSIGTPPWEVHGMEMNWKQDLSARYKEQRDSPVDVLGLPPFETTIAGRANGKPDYYPTPKGDLGPRASLAWTPEWKDGIFGWLGQRGGTGVFRLGYMLTYDRVGGRLAREAAVQGGIGLFTNFASPNDAFSFDGVGVPRAPRVETGMTFPRDAFPSYDTTSFLLPTIGSTPSGVITNGIDPHLHSPSNHLLNATFSKGFGKGWVVEASYVGRFARGLLGQLDLASPVNIRDSKSGQTCYDAMAQLFTQYEFKGAPVGAVQAIPWFEDVYPEIRALAEQRFGQTFSSATQAFYAILHQSGVTPGPNSQVSLNDAWVDVAGSLGQAKLLTPQLSFLGYFTNLGQSNYHAGQFSLRKRLAAGYSFTVNYTLSTAKDITSAPEAFGTRPDYSTQLGMAQDPYNPDLTYTRSDFDRTHQFNGFFLAELPFGRGKPIGRYITGALNHLVGGWELSGIATAASGLPWNFTAANRYNFHYYGRDTPALVQPIPFGLTKQGSAVYMIQGTSADRTRIALEDFVSSYPGGPVARNQAQGPRMFNLDTAVMKEVRITERLRLQLRAEAFNVLNHPNFAIPSDPDAHNIDRTGGNLGQITETVATERVMQFGVRLEF